jgi:uncharacterized protein (DUF433 family)
MTLLNKQLQMVQERPSMFRFPTPQWNREFFSKKLCSRAKVLKQSMNFADYFQRDPGICGGETVLRGTRVTLRTVLASLAEGSSFEEILLDYPSLSEEHVRAVVAFAATSAKEDLPIQSLPAGK